MWIVIRLVFSRYHRKPSIVVLKNMCSENTQQIYMRIPIPKFHFNEVASQLC